MANILQVTTPSVNDNRNIQDTQDARSRVENPRIQNPVDPSRVVRADGREDGKAGNATGEGTYSVIDFESNYGAFIQKFGDTLELPQLLQQLLFRDAAGYLFTDGDAMGSLLEKALSSIQMHSPEDILDFFKGQEQLQAKFTGVFFDGLRGLFARNPSDALQDAVTAFLKGYNDFSAGRHFLQQMSGLTDDISRLMLGHYREEFQDLVNTMDWNAENGNTQANTAVLNSRLIPFLSTYISKAHDYGPVRNAVMLLILNAVRYENGGEDKLWQLFQRMTENRDFERLYKGDARADLEIAMSTMNRQSESGSFADLFADLLLKGANGHAGLENIQQFYSIMNSMLLQESVYLPLLHILVPFQYEDKSVMSEIWVDPDAGKEDDENGRKIKMLLKFDIHSLGRFELVLALQDRQVDMQLYVPSQLKAETDSILDHISSIVKKNGFGLSHLLVREKKGEIRVEDVFPEIREKENTINVRI